MKKRLLLVGRDSMALQPGPGFDLKLGENWEVVAAPTAQAALALLQQTEVTSVITGLQLPDTSGPQFLDAVLERHPATQRFILADLTERENMRKCTSMAHQFLSLPCDAATLLVGLDRASKIDTLFGDDEVKKLVGRARQMPSPPSSYFQIVRELQSLNTSMDTIGAVIGQDPAVTAKLIQLANSAVFGLQRPVSSPAEAVLFLGIETTKSMVLTAHTFSFFERVNLGAFTIESLWRHSLATARLARLVAREENASTSFREEAFTAGLLHDLGKLLLAANEPEHYRKIQALATQRDLADWEAEREILGVTHADLGGWLMAIWGLPLAIVEAIALHHHPTQLVSEGFSLLTAVHVANAICHEQTEPGGVPGPSQVDSAYVAGLGLEERVEVWRRLGRAVGSPA